MTQYFVRFVLDKNQATRDKRRGYSFEGYQFFSTVADLRDYCESVGLRCDQVGRCREGFGLRLNGLCGFGPYHTLQDAESEALYRRGYNGARWPVAAIYQGRFVEAGYDGDIFHPTHLVKTIRLG